VILKGRNRALALLVAVAGRPRADRFFRVAPWEGLPCDYVFDTDSTPGTTRWSPCSGCYLISSWKIVVYIPPFLLSEISFHSYAQSLGAFSRRQDSLLVLSGRRPRKARGIRFRAAHRKWSAPGTLDVSPLCSSRDQCSFSVSSRARPLAKDPFRFDEVCDSSPGEASIPQESAWRPAVPTSRWILGRGMLTGGRVQTSFVPHPPFLKGRLSRFRPPLFGRAVSRPAVASHLRPRSVSSFATFPGPSFHFEAAIA